MRPERLGNISFENLRVSARLGTARRSLHANERKTCRRDSDRQEIETVRRFHRNCPGGGNVACRRKRRRRPEHDPTTVTCQSQWNDSPASEYCTTSWLLQVGSTVADPSDADCDISATCSITFTHGTNGASSTTLTPSLSLAVFGMDDTDELDICVKEETDADGTVSYTAVLRTACRANEYTSVQTTTGQFHD